MQKEHRRCANTLKESVSVGDDNSKTEQFGALKRTPCHQRDCVSAFTCFGVAKIQMYMLRRCAEHLHESWTAEEFHGCGCEMSDEHVFCPAT